MAVVKNGNTPTTRKSRPATTPEARDKQLQSLAYDVAEKLMREGKASSQIITHFLKRGTEEARLERQKLEHETELVKAKTEAIKNSSRSEIEYKEIIKALRSYAGYDGDENED